MLGSISTPTRFYLNEHRIGAQLEQTGFLLSKQTAHNYFTVRALTVFRAFLAYPAVFQNGLVWDSNRVQTLCREIIMLLLIADAENGRIGCCSSYCSGGVLLEMSLIGMRMTCDFLFLDPFGHPSQPVCNMLILSVLLIFPVSSWPSSEGSYKVYPELRGIFMRDAELGPWCEKNCLSDETPPASAVK